MSDFRPLFMSDDQRWFMAHRDSPAWLEAWAYLQAEFGDTACRDEESGECWQYMGTERAPDGSWSHCFRHRALRGAHTYLYRHYPASPPGTLVIH
jgi:hypothetical protein